MSPSKIVVDSSVIVKWLNAQNEKLTREADQLLLDCQMDKIQIFAPELAKYEVGNALLYKKMNLAKTIKSLATLYLIPIAFITETEQSAANTIQIAKKRGITYYDAAFVSLAKKIKGTLVTDNPKHQKITKEINVLPLVDYGKSIS